MMKRLLSLLCTLLMIASCGYAEPEIIVPDEFVHAGTLPIYAAAERDFNGVIKPEMLNQSGIAEWVTGKHNDVGITFNDGAQLSWFKGAIHYATYDGVGEIIYEGVENGEPYAVMQPKPSMAHAASALASWMLFGWPETNQVYALESQSLTQITLADAQAQAEQLFASLGMEGYVCENAIDMSLSRIREMGGKWNELIDEGHILNNHRLDYSAATVQDEGYLLFYNRFGTDGDAAGMFHANVYVTSQGFAYINIYDQYMPGEVQATPDALISWQAAQEALPKELMAARSPMRLEEISRARLTWYPVRAKDEKAGMVLTPVWIINFSTTNDEQGGSGYHATFDAMDSRLIDGNWM